MRGLLLGRFQPFHLGHLAVVRGLRLAHPEASVVLGIGSAQESYTWANPFTASERFEMIERALLEAGIAGVTAVPVTDIDRHAVWVAHVESMLPTFERVYTNNPLTRLLFERAGYSVESPALVERTRFEGERIRRALLAGKEWESHVPPAVRGVLREIRAEERLRGLPDAPKAPARERRRS